MKTVIPRNFSLLTFTHIMEKPKQTPAKNASGNVLSLILILGIAFIVALLLVVSLAELSNRETTLLGTILTLLSVAIGWGISHFYATTEKDSAVEEVRDFHQRNLRTYALKAAEKVTNLSKELHRLSAYLQEELQYTEYRNPEEELFAKEERIESAIHMLASLRSINDTSLSDWQGVIGEELDEQRQTEEDQAEALRELADRISALEVVPVTPMLRNENDAGIDALKREVRTLASQISSVPFQSKIRPSFQQVKSICPSCNSPIQYRQRAKENDRKAVSCSTCSANLISTYREANGFLLSIRSELKESVVCPACSDSIQLMLDEWPSSSTTTSCASCGTQVRVSRSDKGASVKTNLVLNQKSSEPLTPELIEKVKQALPSQPWPQGIHQTLAIKFELRPTTVQKAIQHLIRTGEFSDQVDGVICTAAEKLQLMRSVGKQL